ncbi:MAG: hypothetical protein ACM3TR_04175 [Caulobacteraceae bacterium]
MGKLGLVIADIDENYVRGLINYIEAANSRDFQVSSFTQLNSFQNFLSKNKLSDIILVCPEFYEETALKTEAKLVVILFPGVLDKEYPGCETVNKYQTGEKIISNIFYLYSKVNPDEVHISNCEKRAKVVGIYSPAGGTGKTTIAASLSSHCVEQGLSSFYLNFENIQSTEIFFDCSSERSLSYVFYYLKEKDKNLTFKIDGVKCLDTSSGVQYFTPPQSPLELDEVAPDELEQLLHQLKRTGKYDFVFIDMSSAFDTKNIRLMQLCDQVIAVYTQDLSAKHKFRTLVNNLDKLDSTFGHGLSAKFISVINKYKENPYDSMDDNLISRIPLRCKIPEYSKSIIQENGKIAVNDSSFLKSVDELINVLLDR